jgi:uncharacterized protein
LLVPDSKPRRALDRAFQEGKVLLSFATLAELYDVLHRKQFRRYVDEEDARSFVATLARESVWIDVNVQINTCRDPKDNKFLEVAVRARQLNLSLATQICLCLIPSKAFEFFPLRNSWIWHRRCRASHQQLQLYCFTMTAFHAVRPYFLSA